MPGIGVASGVGHDRAGRMADGEMEGVHLGATVGIKVREGVVSGLGVSQAVPGIGVTGSVGHGGVGRVEDGEVKDDE